MPLDGILPLEKIGKVIVYTDIQNVVLCIYGVAFLIGHIVFLRAVQNKNEGVFKPKGDKP